ncbi:hypothetical protein NDN08_002504 [Rhodosorus marinus]|uniref:Neutral/alkaline non-lysosomal ceramidase N-terminal domain-containing protein n=1 Tax=Rhodosorus marinus TaxID=101924 RepID=A0AAV8UTY8_9RHOD|nr:hypothetical protein NDN08_002504 [Rhodosorus marinus]
MRRTKCDGIIGICFILGVGVVLDSLTFIVLLGLNPRGEFAVGVKWVDVTPDVGLPMAGFSSRNRSAEGVLDPLRVTGVSLVHRDTSSQLLVLTYDLIGASRELSDQIYEKLHTRFRAKRESTLLFFSHTHSGPVVGRNLRVLHKLSPNEQKLVDAYARRLVQVSENALQGAIESAEDGCTLSASFGQSNNAVNRVYNSEKGFELGGNVNGPFDHTVPVFIARRRDRTVLSCMFGYAAHGTVLTKEYRYSNDWMGFARRFVENSLPGATAVYIPGCSGDTNLYPRGDVSLAKEHANRIAEAVISDGSLRNEQGIGGRIKCRHQEVNLNYKALTHDRRNLKRLSRNEEDTYSSRLANLILLELPRLDDTFFQSLSYPVWVCSIGNSTVFVALSGEPTSEYSLILRQRLKGLVFAAGYAGEVMGYIPSKEMVRHGGYEAGERSAVLYGLPGRFGEDIEDTILKAVVECARAVEE